MVPVDALESRSTFSKSTHLGFCDDDTGCRNGSGMGASVGAVRALRYNVLAINCRRCRGRARNGRKVPGSSTVYGDTNGIVRRELRQQHRAHSVLRLVWYGDLSMPYVTPAMQARLIVCLISFHL
jgi:hypothetical protein